MRRTSFRQSAIRPLRRSSCSAGAIPDLFDCRDHLIHLRARVVVLDGRLPCPEVNARGLDSRDGGEFLLDTPDAAAAGHTFYFELDVRLRHNSMMHPRTSK